MRILLAVDDSKHAEDAVRGLTHFFTAAGTQVKIVQVVPTFAISAPPQMAPGYAPELEDLVKDAGAIVEKYREELRAAGYQAQVIVERGDVRESIVDAASAWNADLIVVGCGERKGVGRLLLGSVAESIVRRATCSVLVVRTDSKP